MKIGAIYVSKDFFKSDEWRRIYETLYKDYNFHPFQSTCAEDDIIIYAACPFFDNDISGGFNIPIYNIVCKEGKFKIDITFHRCG